MEKLKNLLSKSKPWKGLPCGREECQPGELNENYDKRNIIYENICKIFNPQENEKRKKKESLEDVGPEASFYVGESACSLHERTSEYWKD